MKLKTVLLCSLILAACGNNESARQPEAPWVRTHVVGGADGLQLALTGTVRARYETPLAFRVGGQISTRGVDAGQQVKAGQVLFRLDPRDLAASLQAASAERAAAKAAWDTAHADTERHRQLFEQGFVSRQMLERVELSEREVKSRLDAAESHWQQARNATAYGVLRADAAGVLMDVTGEPGQVVAAGQAVAVLAQDGEREVEVFFPESVQAPPAGIIRHADGASTDLQLREVAGAVDPSSRTWRARYRLLGDGAARQALGTVLSARFTLAHAAISDSLEVPLGALDERGQGPQVWHIVEGKAQPLPVRVLTIGPESARIHAELPAGTRLIALGTHLLKPGMAVRELEQ